MKKKLITPFRVGVGLTASWLLIGAIEVVRRGGLEALACMKLNEVGDFFAGLFAPVAFLWLVLGYRQQGDELIASLEHQKESAEIARKQLDVELQTLARERQQHSLAVTPVLSMWVTREVKGANVYEMEIRVRNTGGDAHSLVVAASLLNGGASQVLLDEDLVLTGSTTQGLLRLPGSFPREVIVLTATFRDRDNKSHCIRLHMQHLEGVGWRTRRMPVPEA